MEPITGEKDQAAKPAIKLPPPTTVQINAIPDDIRATLGEAQTIAEVDHLVRHCTMLHHNEEFIHLVKQRRVDIRRAMNEGGDK